jgi:hypothetical protein
VSKSQLGRGAHPEKPACKKGIGENPENIGTMVAIMRIIDLIP